jgi:hypothetical protein
MLQKVDLINPIFKDSCFIKDHIKKHQPVWTFGMLCENTYYKYFKNI